MLVILDVDEPSVQICATINCGANIRAAHVNLSLPNLNIKTESADQPVRHLCIPLLKKYTISSFYTQNAMYLARAIRFDVYLDETLKIGRDS